MSEAFANMQSDAAASGASIKLSELRSARHEAWCERSLGSRRRIDSGLGLSIRMDDGRCETLHVAITQKIDYSHDAGGINMFASPMPAIDEVLASNIQFLMRRTDRIKFNLTAWFSFEEIPGVVS